MAVGSTHKPRGFSTICLPIRKDCHNNLINSPDRFRQWLD